MTRPNSQKTFQAGGVHTTPPVSPFKAGIGCRCPHCGEGPLFHGFLKVADRCSVCGTSFEDVENADGPAVFVILILGFIVAFAALYVEFSYSPPYWVHLILWLPLILGGSAAMLRPLKATMIALQVHHGAREGRLQEDTSD